MQKQLPPDQKSCWVRGYLLTNMNLKFNRCRTGSAALLRDLNKLWPMRQSPSTALRSRHLCGPDLPRGYWVWFLTSTFFSIMCSSYLAFSNKVVWIHFQLQLPKTIKYKYMYMYIYIHIYITDNYFCSLRVVSTTKTVPPIGLIPRVEINNLWIRFENLSSKSRPMV